MRIPFGWSFGILASLIVGLSACGGGDDPKPEPKAHEASISSFTVDPEIAAAGESVTASWTTAHAVSIGLTANGVAVDLGDSKPAQGSATIEVGETTVFVFEATGAKGDKVSQTRTVTVAGELPAVVSFDAEPAVLDDAGEVTLSWRTLNAESIRIARAAGGNVDLDGKDPAEGSVAVAVEGTESFTLVAERGADKAEKTVTVTVKGAPVASLTIEPRRIDFGDSTTIAWETTDAVSVVITDADGMVLDGTLETSGSRQISPEFTSTWTLTATGAADKKTRVSAEVEVNPAILSFAAEDDSPAGEGDAKVLTWKTGGAFAVEISNLEGATETFTGAEALEGSASLPLGAAGTFRIVATSGSLQAQQELQIEVVGDPVIGSFEADVDVISLVDGIATVELSWAGVVRADSLELVGDTTGPIDLTGLDLAEGQVEVDIESDTVFTLTARNVAGEATRTAFVRAVPLPVVESFTVLPAYVGAGEEVELVWSTTGATNVTISQDGVELEGPFEASGSLMVEVTVSSDFEIVAYNDALDSDSKIESVTVGAPQIASFEVSSEHVWLGASVGFSWETLGATELTISSAGDVIHSTAIRAEVEQGATLPIALTEEGVFVFTLEIKNASGQSLTQTAVVKVSSGPGISSFAISPSALLSGGEVTVLWTATADPDGALPTLELTADRGGTYELPEGPSGSAQFALTEIGAYEFTLTASTTSAGSTAASATRSVSVYGAPEVTLAAAPTVFDDEIHSGVTLTWTSSNADTSVEIFGIDAGGQAQLYTVPAADRESGSWVAPGPTAPTTYRIVATNGLSMTAQAEAQVTLQGAEILTFTATPPVYPEPPASPAIGVVAGDEVLLEWTTRKSDGVSLNILSSLTFSETSEPYLDVAGGGGTKFTFPRGGWTNGASDEGTDLLTFPTGFTFPFAGADRDSVMILANGVLSFDTTIASSSVGYGNVAFPSSAKAWAHLAVFWDDLRYYGGSDANVYWMHGTDAKSEFVAIEWKDFGFANNETANLNFEVILRATGEFEYRYGTMAPIAASLARAEGNSATIGFQTLGQSQVHLFSHDTAVPGGLTNRSFVYAHPPTLDPNGSYSWRPTGGAGATPRSVTLTAHHANGNDSETATVDVYPRAVVTATGPAAVILGDDITVSWTSSNATDLLVMDDQGATRCTATEAQLASGSCTLTETTFGPKVYSVIATGALGHTVSKDVTSVVVSEDFGIVSFEADEDEIDYAASATLSWETGDAETLKILANGVELALPGTIDLDQDSFVVPLTETTTFELVIGHSLFGTRSSTLTVTVRTATLALTPSATEVKPGQPVTITWDGTSLNGGPVTVEVPFLQMVEDTAGPGFYDISQEPGVVSLINGGVDGSLVSHTFPNGFEFPFDGVNRTSVRVSSDGYLSFSSNTSNTASNQVIPNTSDSYNKVSLAAFWDDLHTRASGRVHAAQVGADYIVQWSHISQYYGSSDTNEYDLNFQIVLHPDGTFEYRYGAMTPPAATSTDCHPATCANEANAASATIGYQNLAGTKGAMLHFGGTSNAAGNPTFSGGLANRTFRYDPPAASGSTTFYPRASGDYTICVVQDDYRKCETIHVDADFEIESFDASPASVEWGETVDFTWVTKGAETFAIKEGGTVIVDDSTMPADGGTFPHQPGGTATYTLEARNSFLNKTITATKVIDVHLFDLALTASTETVNPGDPLTLTWDASATSGQAMVVTTPMADVTGAVAFTDISAKTDVATLIQGGVDSALVEHTFEGGFTFNYLGREYDWVKVSSDGFLSFDSSATSTASSNQTLPNSGATNLKVHIAPFWDDLHTRANGRVYAAPSGSDYIIQWSHVSNYSGSSSYPMDFNFQVVLHPDGSFDFVYDTMAGLTAPNTSSSCYPNTCVNEADGSSATIGYQDPSGVAGHQVHFGGSSNGASNKPFVGGLSNRALRFTPLTGSGSMDVYPSDSRSYVICAVIGAYAACTEPVSVTAEWAIESFDASAERVVSGDDLTLSWATFGGDGFAIKKTEAGVDTYLDVTGLDPDAGSIVDNPNASATYTFELYSLGRIKTATRSIVGRTVSIDFEVSDEAVVAGTDVTLDWTITAHGTGTPLVSLPMYEVDASPGGGYAFADTDISADPGATQAIAGGVDGGTGTLTFPNGFVFPYMGVDYSSVTAVSDGFLTFGSSSASSANQPLPNSNSSYTKVHLAPFWDDLHTRASGRVFGHLVDPDTYVVQYSHISRYGNSSNTNEYDLNFQVVLHSDGSFEFRYGTMAPPPTPTTSLSTCEPLSCVNETNGSSATIGYQDPTGLVGHELHYQGAVSASNVPFAGGLANRTFRFDPNLTSPATLTMERTFTYDVCASLSGYTECQQRTIYVAGEGDVVISELMIDPDGGPANQWFEVRNLLPVEINLEGWTVSTASGGSHVIAGSVAIPPSGHAVLSASAASLAADYVYGAGMPLTVAGDTLTIKAGGRVISSATWDSGTVVPHAVSLELDPHKQSRGAGVFADMSFFCAAEVMYDATSAGTPGEAASCDTLPYRLRVNSTMPFIDIRSTGTAMSSINADSAYGEIPGGLGFTMPYFGQPVSDLWVSSNGFVSFGTLTESYTTNRAMPTAGAAPTGGIVAGFWDDLTSQTGSAFHYERKTVSGEQVTILQWTNYLRWNNGPGSVTFQIQLWQNGEIVIAFENLGPNAHHLGGDATVGIEAPGGTAGVQFSYNQAILVSNTSLHFQAK